MKKIISAAALAAMVAGTAFADVSWSANARVYDDVVTYAAPTRKGKYQDDITAYGANNSRGTDDNGKVTWNKDVKHADDVTLKASGENCGAQITFDVVGPANGSTSNVSVSAYKLWATILPNLTLNAGAYDTRLGKNINNDGNWSTNLSAIAKPGVYQLKTGKPSSYASTDGTTIQYNNSSLGKDSTNLTVIGDASKKWNNFMAQYKVNDNLTAYATMFLMNGGKFQLSNNFDDNVGRFSPWGVGATYAVNKDTKIAVVVRNELNRQGNVTGLTYNRASLNADLRGAKAGLKHGYVTGDTPVVEGGVQSWTAAVDVSTKIAGWDAEAAYTLAALMYDNVDRIYGHSLDYWYHTADLGQGTRASLNEVIHAFDLRAKGKLGDKLTLTALANVSYKPATAHVIHTVAEFGEVKLTKDHINANGSLNTNQYVADVLASKTYKNEDAYNAGKGLSGELAHYESLSVDYAFNSQITFQVMFNHRNTNVFQTSTPDKRVKTYYGYRTRLACLQEAGIDPAAGVTQQGATQVINAAINGTNVELDALKGSTFYLRPAVKYAISKQAQLDAGVEFKLSGLSSVERCAAADETAFAVSVPVTFRVKL